MAVCTLQKLTETAIVYKKAMRSTDLVGMENYLKMMNKMDEYGYVIGHARSSTTDRYTASDHNAHPFQYGSVTLVHNGHVTNPGQLGSGIEHSVDSAHVAGALAQVQPEDAGDVLGKIYGGYAFVWHDARDGSLNFARNSQRPLFWCYVQRENTMFWGSELETTYAILVRNEIAIDGLFKMVSPHKQIKFQAGNLRGFKTIPFEIRQSKNHSSTKASGEHWKDGIRRMIPSPVPSSPPKSEPAGKSTTPAEDGESTTKYIPPKGSLRPRSSRKIRIVNEKLGKLNFTLDQRYAIVPESYRAYANQQNKNGCIRGRPGHNPDQEFEIGNIPSHVWAKANKQGKIYGRICNIKNNDTGKGSVIIMDYDERATKRFVFDRASEVAPPRSPFREGPTTSDLEKFEEEGNIRGPNNRRISASAFRDLTSNGCSWCSDDLYVADADEIMWIGQMTQPLCKTCHSNPKVLSDIGLQITL